MYTAFDELCRLQFVLLDRTVANLMAQRDTLIGPYRDMRRALKLPDGPDLNPALNTINDLLDEDVLAGLCKSISDAHTSEDFEELTKWVERAQGVDRIVEAVVKGASASGLPVQHPELG